MSAKKICSYFAGLFLCAAASPALAQGPLGRSSPELDPASEPAVAAVTENEDGELILELGIGEQKVLSALGVKSFSEGAKGVMDIRLTRNAEQFVLVGLKPGTTTLLFLMLDGSERHYRVVVGGGAPKPVGDAPIIVHKKQNIRLDFYFVQLDRTYSHQIGPGFPTSLNIGAFGMGFDFLTQTITNATAVVANQALLRLDLAQAQGFARVRRQAAVITKNGESATFSGGGEVNVRIVGSVATGIHAIHYGSKIEVLPRYDASSGRLEIQLSADVTDLADDRGTGIPGRTTSQLSTLVNLELGQTIVLAGLSSESDQQSQGGLPGLTQIPVLGMLFSTHRRVAGESENLIFIVPSVVDTPPAEVKADLDAALRLYHDFRGAAADLPALAARRNP